MQFVLDCSVAISWCLVDENNDYANGILAMMPDAEAFVPGIWSLEIANVLLVAERRNRMTTEQSSEAIALLQLSEQKAHKGQLRSNDSCPLGVG